MSSRGFWAGLPLAVGAEDQPAPCVYRRARGVDPSPSEVSFPRSMFRAADLSAALDLRRFSPQAFLEPAALALGESLDSPILVQPIERPPYMGDLVLVHSDGEDERIVRARALYLDQVLVQNPRMSNPLVVFSLADIRKWWGNYGEVTRSWNVRTGRTLATTVPYVAHTAKNGGAQPYSLREIVQSLLDALPGRLPIVRWPAGVGEGDDAPEVRCWAASPKEALRGLLEAFRLSFDPGPDLRARVYSLAEGSIGELEDGGPENLSSWEPETGSGPWAQRIAAVDGNRYARRPTGAPTQVVVVGDRTVYECVQDWCTPVLTYPLERPNEPPETVVIEVTPHSLESLRRGFPQPAFANDPRQQEFKEGVTGRPPEPPSIIGEPGPILPDPLQRAAVNVLMGALAPPVPVVVQGSPGQGFGISDGAREQTAKPGPGEKTGVDLGRAGGVPGSAGAEQADPFAWQRIPLLDDDDYETAYSWLPHGLRSLLREQLWRYWQIPTRRLLPMLKRAERTPAGERLEIEVEAFTFRPVRFQRLRPKDTAEADEKRASQLRLHRWLLDGIDRMKEARERLRDPTFIELAGAIGRRLLDDDNGVRNPLKRDALNALTDIPFYPGGKPIWPFPFDRPDYSSDETVIRDQATFDRASLAVGSRLRQWLALLPDGFPVPDALSWVLSETSELPDTVDAKLKALDKAIEEYRKTAQDLFEELEPRAAMVLELAHLENLMSAKRAVTGSEDPSDALRRRQLKDSLEQDAAKTKARDIAERKPEFEPRTRHENMSRVKVSARVVDAELGIIEILGDLPCWLADPTVQDAAQSYLIPMPVRVTFGTWNRRDYEGRGEDSSGSTTRADADALAARRVPVSDPHQTNPYMQATARMIAGLPREALALIGPTEHVMPSESGTPVAGESQFRLEVNRTQRGSGAVGVKDPEPNRWLVTMDESPPFRELVRLDGTSNRDDLEARARPIAEALLDTPDDTDAGTLTLAYPVQVGCNGRISAVETRLVAGYVFLTEVSFDGDVSPLPGIVGKETKGGPVRLVFGLDVEAGRDR